jgi:hypothetical protein
VSTREIAGLLEESGRPGAPEPTLLPWLARRVGRDGLERVAGAAAACVSDSAEPSGGPGAWLTGRPDAAVRWPAIADAVAQVVAARESDPGRLGRLLSVLPPAAAYLGPAQADRVDWTTAGRDASGYLAVGQAWANRGRPPLRLPWWAEQALDAEAPPLADRRALARYPAARDAGLTGYYRGYPPPPVERDWVYLLPFARRDYALDLNVTANIELALYTGPPWYAAAWLARAAPYLPRGGSQEQRLSRAVSAVPGSWAAHLAELLSRTVPWASTEQEVTGSHLATRRLDELAATADPADLAALCDEVVQRIIVAHGLDRRWSLTPEDPSGYPQPPVARPTEPPWADSPDRPGEPALPRPVGRGRPAEPSEPGSPAGPSEDGIPDSPDAYAGPGDPYEDEDYPAYDDGGYPAGGDSWGSQYDDVDEIPATDVPPPPPPPPPPPLPVPGVTRGLEGEPGRGLGPDLEEPARLVNLYVASPGQPGPAGALALDTIYEVRCNIGPPDPRTLLDRATADWPAGLLPRGPLMLQAVLFQDGAVQSSVLLPLPAAGASPWVALPLPPSPQPRITHADLALYYGAAVVLMYRIELPYGSGRAPRAGIRYRISRSLADLAKLDNRTMSVTVSGDIGRPALYVNGLTFAPAGYRYQPDNVHTLAYQARLELYHAHFTGHRLGETSNFAETAGHAYGKTAAGLDRDLRQLAGLGAELYEQLFRSGDEQTRLLHVLRGEAGLWDRPPVLQIASPASELVPLPWACLYDLPMSGDPREYEPCPSLAEYGPGSHSTPGPARPVPARCPYEDDHWDGHQWKLNQLCPWGFWGLSAIIEHPPSQETRDLAAQIRKGAGPLAILAGYDTQLDSALRTRHLDNLAGIHGPGMLRPFLEGRRDVQAALGLDQMDVVYLYCHIVDDPNWPGRQVPAIQLGTEQVNGKDIRGWTRISRGHPWSRRHPLVILNGCGSVARAPGSLSNLVEAFTDGAGASGVIGTEITIEQGLGGWAMELFLAALRDQPAGAAIRSMRWGMLAHGNLIGLAYTPYCLAGLAIDPQATDPQATDPQATDPHRESA